MHTALLELPIGIIAGETCGNGHPANSEGLCSTNGCPYHYSKRHDGGTQQRVADLFYGKPIDTPVGHVWAGYAPLRADECPMGGSHVEGAPKQEGDRSVIRCTKCGAWLAGAELPSEDR